MSTFARTYRGRLGDLMGDVETSLYKVMIKVHNRRSMDTPKGVVSIQKTDTGASRIYLDEQPIMQHGIDAAMDVLEFLEESGE
jgi:hypothetical protein